MDKPQMAGRRESPLTQGLLEAPKKTMAIRLRWLIVISSSYLLLYSQQEGLVSSTIYNFILAYLLSNVALYYVPERAFELSYFYAPLVVLDTFCVTISLMVSGQAGADFYLTYFLIIILCAVLQDFYGSLVVSGLAAFAYGYLLFDAAEVYDPSIFLRLPFLFVTALFYGYFVQIARREKALRTEAQIRELVAEKEAEAERVKSEFLLNTTHELRTPLAAIMGYGELLIDGGFGPLTEEQKKAVERLTESTQGLFRLVEQILDYSKLEKGETGLTLRQEQIAPVLDELRQELYDLERKKPFKIRYEVGDDIPAIITDWAKLKRVLINILSNALKFTHQGEVKLSVSKRPDGNICFVVSDTGIGIPQSKIPLIFERFRQLDGSQTRRYGGAGLGLAICKNFVDLIGGKIDVESEVERGTTFTVTIPEKVR